MLSPSNPTNPVAVGYDGSGSETGPLVSGGGIIHSLIFGGGSAISFAGERYQWQVPISNNPAEYASRPVFYCVGDPGERCVTIVNADIGSAPVAWDYATRFPVQLTIGENFRDVDLFLSRFAVLKTFRANSEYLVFGTAVSVKLTQTVTMTDPRGLTITFGRYNRDELVAFVDGPRFDRDANQLPQSGYAAYRGFANAYAESTNRNFLPFSAEAEQGAYFGFGHAAMVFSFANGVANFEHGYIDLFGQAFPDRVDGGAVVAFADLDTTNPLGPALSGRFADPEYLDGEAFGEVPGYVDASRYVNRVAGYADNPERQVEIGLYRRWFGPDVAVNTRADFTRGRSSGLAFRLTGNSETDDTMDFTMDLISISHGLDPSETSCYVPDPNVVCYSSRSAPNGAGLTELYGAPLELTSTANDEVDGAPNLAGGVWQYNQIVYVDTKGTNTESDDELLGIVDLTGTLGGLFYLAPSGSTPSP